MRDFRVYKAALGGEEGPLREQAGPEAVICVAPSLSSVLVTHRDADGHPEGMIALVGASGGGTLMWFAWPEALPVIAIDHDDSHFTVTVADGRRIVGTPEQFSAGPLLIGPEHNPDYQAQLTESFLAIPTLPEIGAPLDRHPSLTDPMLGEIFFDSSIGQYAAGVSYPLPDPPVVALSDSMGRPDSMGRSASSGGGRLAVSFDGAGRDRVAQLLPSVRALLTGWSDLRRRTTEFLWDWGVSGDETPAERDRFLATVCPTSMVVYRSGDFALHFEDLDEEFFPEGYWPVVSHRADGTPVCVIVEA